MQWFCFRPSKQQAHDVSDVYVRSAPKSTQLPKTTDACTHCPGTSSPPSQHGSDFVDWQTAEVVLVPSSKSSGAVRKHSSSGQHPTSSQISDQVYPQALFSTRSIDALQLKDQSHVSWQQSASVAALGWRGFANPSQPLDSNGCKVQGSAMSTAQHVVPISTAFAAACPAESAERQSGMCAQPSCPAAAQHQPPVRTDVTANRSFSTEVTRQLQYDGTWLQGQAAGLDRCQSMVNPSTPSLGGKDSVGERWGVDMQKCTKELSYRLGRDGRLKCVLSKIDVIRLQTHVLMCALGEDTRGAMGPYVLTQLMMQHGYSVALYDITAEHVLATLRSMGVSHELLILADGNLRAARARFDPVRRTADARSVISAPARTTPGKGNMQCIFSAPHSRLMSAPPTELQEDLDDEGYHNDTMSILSLDQDDEVDERLVHIMGDRKIVERGINAFWYRCTSDPLLSKFFSGGPPAAVKASMLRFFANAFGVHHVSAERMFRIHTGMVARGLNMDLFFYVMECFLGSLHSVGLDEDVAAIAEVNFRASQVLFEDIIAKARARRPTEVSEPSCPESAPEDSSAEDYPAGMPTSRQPITDTPPSVCPFRVPAAL